MINTLEARIQNFCAHYIGIGEHEQLELSAALSEISSDRLHSSLLTYFFKSFTLAEFFSFDSKIEQHHMLALAKEIFDQPSGLLEHSRAIAQHLHNSSQHPNIKSGDLIVAYVSNVLIEDEILDAICIFKSEKKHDFIGITQDDNQYTLEALQGMLLSHIDKACIIFNTEQSSGYKVCSIDKSNTEKNAQFWQKDFLQLKFRDDDFHNTKGYIGATKHFIEDRMKPLFDTDKSEEVGILQRSKSFLEQEENFDAEEYTKEIFRDERVIKEFNDYKQEYENLNNLDLKDSFSVNMAAVKNQSRVFKSVLKLDKNFHVYIHGNRNMITKGRDEDGRKYYKLYYDEET